MGFAAIRTFGLLIVGGTPRKTITLTIRSLVGWVSPWTLPNLRALSDQNKQAPLVIELPHLAGI